MKKLLPVFVASFFCVSSLLAQMDDSSAAASPSPSAAASPSPSNHKHHKKSSASGSPGSALSTSTATPAPGGGPGLVWVNTSSHVYHKYGTKWYGKTKHGKYMTEQAATAEGDHAAGGEGATN
jgi:hypothetical protein